MLIFQQNFCSTLSSKSIGSGRKKALRFLSISSTELLDHQNLSVKILLSDVKKIPNRFHLSMLTRVSSRTIHCAFRLKMATSIFSFWSVTAWTMCAPFTCVNRHRLWFRLRWLIWTIVWFFSGRGWEIHFYSSIQLFRCEVVHFGDFLALNEKKKSFSGLKFCYRKCSR